MEEAKKGFDVLDSKALNTAQLATVEQETQAESAIESLRIQEQFRKEQEEARKEGLKVGQEMLVEMRMEQAQALEIIGNTAQDLGTVVGGGFGDVISTSGAVIKGLAGVAAAVASGGIAEQAKLPFPANVAAIGTTAAAILSAFSAIKKAGKFATGTKFLEGAGTGTSDSIPAWLSRGERVETAENNRLYGSAYDFLTDRKVSPQGAINALEAARQMEQRGGAMPIGLGFPMPAQADNSDVVDAINQKEMSVNIVVKDGAISSQRGQDRHTRLGNRYSY